MAGSINKAVLIGNVGRDPVIRTISSNKKEVAVFPLATSESWRDRVTGERRERTEWHNIVVYNDGLIHIIKLLVNRGTKLFIEGSIASRKWGKDIRDQRVITEIILQGKACSLMVLDSKGGSNGNGGTMSISSGKSDSDSGSESDLDSDDFVDLGEMLDDEFPPSS